MKFALYFHDDFLELWRIEMCLCQCNIHVRICKFFWPIVNVDVKYCQKLYVNFLPMYLLFSTLCNVYWCKFCYMLQKLSVCHFYHQLFWKLDFLICLTKQTYSLEALWFVFNILQIDYSCKLCRITIYEIYICL